MTLVEELMTDLWEKETAPNTAKRIKINPDWLDKLKEEVEREVTHKFHDDGTLTFRGIPLEKTDSVEKWEIIV